MRSLLYGFAAAMALAATGVTSAAADSPPLVVGACSGCHGQNGEGVGSIPKIAGFAKGDFVAILQAFRKDERKPASIMGRIAKGYTDGDYEAMAAWFSSVGSKKK